jgi:PAS domain-containing protein
VCSGIGSLQPSGWSWFRQTRVGPRRVVAGVDRPYRRRPVAMVSATICCHRRRRSRTRRACRAGIISALLPPAWRSAPRWRAPVLAALCRGGRYRLLARNMTDVIVLHGLNGVVLFASPAAEPLFACATGRAWSVRSRASRIGRPISPRLPTRRAR